MGSGFRRPLLSNFPRDMRMHSIFVNFSVLHYQSFRRHEGVYLDALVLGLQYLSS